MPSPIGHTLAGLGGYLIARQRILKNLSRFQLLLVSVAIANFPDLDIIPGLLLVGDPKAFHRQATHSFFIAAIMGIAIAYLIKFPKEKRKWISVWVTGLYSLHILLDMLVNDIILPAGVQAFWPFSSNYFISPIAIFRSFKYSDPNLGLSKSILSTHNLLTVLQEIILLSPFVLLTFYVTQQNKRSINRRK